MKSKSIEAPTESGEPTFTLRASDQCAAGALEHYADLLEMQRGDARLISRARNLAGQFRTWPDRKMPEHPEPMPVAEPKPIEGVEFGEPATEG